MAKSTPKEHGHAPALVLGLLTAPALVLLLVLLVLVLLLVLGLLTGLALVLLLVLVLLTGLGMADRHGCAASVLGKRLPLIYFRK